MNRKLTFRSKPGLVPLANGHDFRLNGALRGQLPDGGEFAVPSGFKTDLASVPPLGVVGGSVMAIGYALTLVSQWFGLLVMLGYLICLASAYIKAFGKYTYSAVFHDWMFRSHAFSFTVCNWYFLAGMKSEHTAAWIRWLMWFNVQAFGWPIYKNEHRHVERISPAHLVSHD